MYYEVTPEGDTVFMETLDPVWILPRGRKAGSADWRRYYKLVYNFNKVYPFAQVGRTMMAQVGSTNARCRLARGWCGRALWTANAG